MMTPREVATRLSVSCALIYKLCDKRKLRHHRIGGLIRIEQEHLDEYLASCEVAPIDGDTERPKAPRRVRGRVIPEYVPLKERIKRGAGR